MKNFEVDELIAQVIGRSETIATAMLQSINLRVRIVKRDGHHFICTRDYRLDRVNLEVEQQIVIKAHVG